MSDHPVKSVVVSVASQPGSSFDGTDRQRSDIRTLIKKSWSTVTTSIKIALLAVLYSPAIILVALKDSLADIWVPLGRHVWGAIIGKIEVNLSMQQRRELLVTLVPHMVLCLTMTFLLPISFLRKLILIMGNFPPITRERILHTISCIALLVDPLFFYIPFIDEKRKCIGMDKELRAVVLALRSLIDLAFALHIDALIDVNDVISYEEITSRGLKWLSQDIIINVLLILPIQQV
ncbi:uncharacterized protein LOC133729335 [Rosa rugosa]|uniref:uncharacterized protein LOC133729335 n=1 Tax=Rosa rugosa TaxID=74645 RepID=UPI002B410DE5|nr:uncharacterized protein LOC133729335 [Rosa rugosa]